MLAKKRLLFAFLFLCCFATCLYAGSKCFETVYADESQPTASDFGSGNEYGTGTEEDPYIISSDNIDVINSLLEYKSGKYFKLKEQLVLSSLTAPIGTAEHPFDGVFDGANFGVTYNLTDGSTNYLGLFGYTKGAVIKNLRLKDCTIKVTNTSLSTIYAGLLVGYAENTEIYNCGIENEETGTNPNSIELSSNGPFSIGSFAGYISGVGVCDCYAKCLITATATNSSALSHQIGGIVGTLASAKVINTLSNVKINLSGGTTDDVDSVGGIVGILANKSIKIYNSIFINDFNNSDDNSKITSLGTKNIGAILGSVDNYLPANGDISYCYFVCENDAIGQANFNDSQYTNSKLQQKDITFFQSITNYEISENFYEFEPFDFKKIWTIYENNLKLQILKDYKIELLSTSINDYELSFYPENSSGTFYYGDNVLFKVIIKNPAQYSIASIRHDGAKANYVVRDGSDCLFVCDATTEGTYSVELKLNTYSVTVKIPAEYKNECHYRLGDLDVATSTMSVHESEEEGDPAYLYKTYTYSYGQEFYLSHVVNDTSEYAFSCWNVYKNSELSTSGTGVNAFYTIEGETVFDLVLTKDFFFLKISKIGNGEALLLKKTDDMYNSVHFDFKNSNKVENGEYKILFKADENYEIKNISSNNSVTAEKVDESDLKLGKYVLFNSTAGGFSSPADFSVEFSKIIPPKKPINIWIFIGPGIGLAVGGLITLIILLKKKGGGGYKSKYRF